MFGEINELSREQQAYKDFIKENRKSIESITNDFYDLIKMHLILL